MPPAPGSPGQLSWKGAALALHPGPAVGAHPCLQGIPLEGREPVGLGLSTASNKTSLTLWDLSHRQTCPTYSTAHQSMSYRGDPLLPPPLRERKAPDSSHITLWWQSEEHPDSWDSEQATFSGQSHPPTTPP